MPLLLRLNMAQDTAVAKLVPGITVFWQGRPNDDAAVVFSI
jgi:hypothetical protein